MSSDIADLSALVQRNLTNFRSLLYCERNLGDQLYAMGLKESIPNLAHTLREFGDAHRALEKEGGISRLISDLDLIWAQ